DGDGRRRPSDLARRGGPRSRRGRIHRRRHGRRCGRRAAPRRGGAARPRVAAGAAVVRPDVVVMERRLSDGDGAQATAEVLAVSPASRILVLSASDERDDVLEAVKAGETGYLVKSASKHELGDAVRATAEGRAVFTPGLAGLV